MVYCSTRNSFLFNIDSLFFPSLFARRSPSLQQLAGLGRDSILRDKDLYLYGSLSHSGVALVSLNVPVRAPLVSMLSGRDTTISRIQKKIPEICKISVR